MKALFYSGLMLLTCVVQAEVYSWKDQNGRTHFSDKPISNENYTITPISPVQAIPSPSQSNVDDLEGIAKKMRKDRMKWQKTNAAERKKKKQLNKQWKQKLAAKEKKAGKCKRARVQQDKAFRKRMAGVRLGSKVSALEKYEQASDKVKKYCY